MLKKCGRDQEFTQGCSAVGGAHQRGLLIKTADGKKSAGTERDDIQNGGHNSQAAIYGLVEGYKFPAGRLPTVIIELSNIATWPQTVRPRTPVDRHSTGDYRRGRPGTRGPQPMDNYRPDCERG